MLKCPNCEQQMNEEYHVRHDPELNLPYTKCTHCESNFYIKVTVITQQEIENQRISRERGNFKAMMKKLPVLERDAIIKMIDPKKIVKAQDYYCGCTTDTYLGIRLVMGANGNQYCTHCGSGWV